MVCYLKFDTALCCVCCCMMMVVFNAYSAAHKLRRMLQLRVCVSSCDLVSWYRLSHAAACTNNIAQCVQVTRASIRPCWCPVSLFVWLYWKSALRALFTITRQVCGVMQYDLFHTHAVNENTTQMFTGRGAFSKSPLWVFLFISSNFLGVSNFLQDNLWN